MVTTSGWNDSVSEFKASERRTKDALSWGKSEVRVTLKQNNTIYERIIKPTIDSMVYENPVSCENKKRNGENKKALRGFCGIMLRNFYENIISFS